MLVVTGGTNGDRVYGPEHDTVHSFDTTTGRWAQACTTLYIFFVHDLLNSQIAVPPATGLPPRFAHAAASVMDGMFIVLGGLNPFGVSTSAQASLVDVGSGLTVALTLW